HKSLSEPNLLKKIDVMMEPSTSKSIAQKSLSDTEQIFESSFVSETDITEPTFSYRNILLAIDHTNMAHRIVNFTIDELVDKTYNSRDIVHLLTVVNYDIEIELSGQDVLGSIKRLREKQVLKTKYRMGTFERICEQNNLAYATHIIASLSKAQIGEKIVSKAKELKCKLIVLGKTHLKFAKKLIHRSVSKHCIEKSPIPVIVIRD
ncbi:hypothetical protein MHBO_000015, partial [Bonamia ostreae]